VRAVGEIDDGELDQLVGVGVHPVVSVSITAPREHRLAGDRRL
jgi:hypothetical protein